MSWPDLKHSFTLETPGDWNCSSFHESLILWFLKVEAEWELFEFVSSVQRQEEAETCERIKAAAAASHLRTCCPASNRQTSLTRPRTAGRRTHWCELFWFYLSFYCFGGFDSSRLSERRCRCRSRTTLTSLRSKTSVWAPRDGSAATTREGWRCGAGRRRAKRSRNSR